MTLVELKQYRGICAELKDLETKIHKSKVCDTVSGSDAEYPYTKHTMRISGVSENDKDLLEKQSQLRDRKKRIEDFINNIPDITTRLIFIKRFIEGKSWKNTVCSLGSGYSEESIKKICYRYLKKSI